MDKEFLKKINAAFGIVECVDGKDMKTNKGAHNPNKATEYVQMDIDHKMKNMKVNDLEPKPATKDI